MAAISGRRAAFLPAGPSTYETGSRQRTSFESSRLEAGRAHGLTSQLGDVLEADARAAGRDAGTHPRVGLAILAHRASEDFPRPDQDLATSR
jgi:hypothetical protein